MASASPPYSFCTSVLRARDLDRAADFYGRLVGWTSLPVAGSRDHRLLQLDGRTVASLHQGDGPDVWVPHVSVESIDRTTAEAVKLGATRVDTADVGGMARLSTLRDPEGALFGLWQPAPHSGAEVTGTVGSLWWIEVMSNDVPEALAFYERLFGWTSVQTAFEPFSRYFVFKRGDAQEGGLLPIGPGWEVPPRWNTIFEVQDADAALARAAELSGETVFVHTVPKHGRIGILCDAGGAIVVVRGPVPTPQRPDAQP